MSKDYSADDIVVLSGLDTRERQIAASADLLVAASPVVADIWRGRGIEPVLIPFGADVDAYAGTEHAPLPADADLPGPVAGFVGRINHRTDLRLPGPVSPAGRSQGRRIRAAAVRCPAAAAQRALGGPEAVRRAARLPAGDRRGREPRC